jgi:hypothetical protein
VLSVLNRWGGLDDAKVSLIALSDGPAEILLALRSGIAVVARRLSHAGVDGQRLPGGRATFAHVRTYRFRTERGYGANASNGEGGRKDRR